MPALLSATRPTQPCGMGTTLPLDGTTKSVGDTLPLVAHRHRVEPSEGRVSIARTAPSGSRPRSSGRPPGPDPPALLRSAARRVRPTCPGRMVKKLEPSLTGEV